MTQSLESLEQEILSLCHSPITNAKTIQAMQHTWRRMKKATVPEPPKGQHDVGQPVPDPLDWPYMNYLIGRVIGMCTKRQWSLHWTARGAYLNLESAELIEAIRGKKGDPVEEAGDVLMVFLSILGSQCITWRSVINAMVAKLRKLETSGPYKGEELTAKDITSQHMDAIMNLAAIGRAVTPAAQPAEAETYGWKAFKASGPGDKWIVRCVGVGPLRGQFMRHSRTWTADITEAKTFSSKSKAEHYANVVGRYSGITQSLELAPKSPELEAKSIEQPAAEPQLANCPFCNSDECEIASVGQCGPAYRVECTRCGAEGGVDSDKKEAIDKWNLRYVKQFTDEEMQELIELHELDKRTRCNCDGDYVHWTKWDAEYLEAIQEVLDRNRDMLDSCFIEKLEESMSHNSSPPARRAPTVEDLKNGPIKAWCWEYSHIEKRECTLLKIVDAYRPFLVECEGMRIHRKHCEIELVESAPSPAQPHVSPSIDWSSVPEEFLFAYSLKDGQCFVCQTEPWIDKDTQAYWDGRGKHVYIGQNLIPGPWQQSKQQRPD